jgi:hypothetical protein
VTGISDSTTIEDLAALVSEALTRAGITAVLSGGGAVQIYTSGLYVSRDLDFVSSAGVREISAAVRPLGFERTSGRHFVHAKCPFTLEFPPWPLAVGRQLLQEWSERRVAHGVIQMLSPTQCLMDRLAAFYFWKDRQALDQAVAVARTHDVDRHEVQRWSESEGRLAEFREFVRALERHDN